MFRMTNKYVGLNPFILCDLFDKMILPILTYGSEVWGYHKGDAIERVHREFLKGLLKDEKHNHERVCIWSVWTHTTNI